MLIAIDPVPPLPDPLPRSGGEGASALLLAIACLFPTLATWLYFVRLSGSDWALYVYGATKAIQFAIPVLWWMASARAAAPSPARRRRGGSGRGLFLGLLSGLALAVVSLLAWRPILAASPAFADTPAAVADKVASFGIDSAAKFFLLAAFYSVIHSFLEEYYWRWFVFGGLRRKLPLGAAMAVSSLAFTSHHVLVVGQYLGRLGPPTLAVSLVVTAAGLLWAWLYQRTGRLAGPWLSHALADAGLMWIGFLMWSGG